MTIAGVRFYITLLEAKLHKAFFEALKELPNEILTIKVVTTRTPIAKPDPL